MTRDKIPEQDFDALLAKRLRNSSPYIEDAGFTAHVLQKLPQRDQRRSRIRRLGVLGGGAALCAAMPFAFSAGMDVVRWTYELDLQHLIQLGLVTFGVALGAALVWLVRELDWI